MRYLGKFATSGDVQTAVDNGELLKPYVALVGDSEIDYNSKSVDVKKLPLTFEIISGGTFSFSNYLGTGGTQVMFSYVLNNNDAVSATSFSIEVSEGDTLTFYGNFSGGTYWQTGAEYKDKYLFGGNSKYNVYGNLMSLCDNNYKSITNSPGKFCELFSGTGVVSAGDLALPSSVIEIYGCFLSMFEDCTSLTTAPDLIIDTLTENTYRRMFLNCSSLNYIKCLATSELYGSNFYRWVDGVSATGTFVKKAGSTFIDSNIPSGWTVIEE